MNSHLLPTCFSNMQEPVELSTKGQALMEGVGGGGEKGQLRGHLFCIEGSSGSHWGSLSFRRTAESSGQALCLKVCLALSQLVHLPLRMRSTMRCSR